MQLLSSREDEGHLHDRTRTRPPSGCLSVYFVIAQTQHGTRFALVAVIDGHFWLYNNSYFDHLPSYLIFYQLMMFLDTYPRLSHECHCSICFSLRLARDFLDYIWLHRFIITTIIIIFTQSLDTFSLSLSLDRLIDWHSCTALILHSSQFNRTFLLVTKLNFYSTRTETIFLSSKSITRVFFVTHTVIPG